MLSSFTGFYISQEYKAEINVYAKHKSLFLLLIMKSLSSNKIYGNKHTIYICNKTIQFLIVCLECFYRDAILHLLKIKDYFKEFFFSVSFLPQLYGSLRNFRCIWVQCLHKLSFCSWIWTKIYKVLYPILLA